MHLFQEGHHKISNINAVKDLYFKSKVNIFNPLVPVDVFIRV